MKRLDYGWRASKVQTCCIRRDNNHPRVITTLNPLTEIIEISEYFHSNTISIRKNMPSISDIIVESFNPLLSINNPWKGCSRKYLCSETTQMTPPLYRRCVTWNNIATLNMFHNYYQWYSISRWRRLNRRRAARNIFSTELFLIDLIKCLLLLVRSRLSRSKGGTTSGMATLLSKNHFSHCWSLFSREINRNCWHMYPFSSVNNEAPAHYIRPVISKG